MLPFWAAFLVGLVGSVAISASVALILGITNPGLGFLVGFAIGAVVMIASLTYLTD